MSQKRKQYRGEFKAKVALEAIREEMTVAQLAQKHGLHPTMVNQWKRQLLAHAAEVFGRGEKQEETAATVAELYRQIGQLKVECDFLGQRSGVAPWRSGAR